MSKTLEITSELARKIADSLSVQTFRNESYIAKNNAQRNLSGRTHYASDDTLRFFHARIQSAREIDHGTIFMIVESVAGDHQNRTRGFRFVAFDLCGTVINDRKAADSAVLHKSSAKAEAEMWEWADAFNPAAHYAEVLQVRAAKADKLAADMRAAAAILA